MIYAPVYGYMAQIIEILCTAILAVIAFGGLLLATLALRDLNYL